MHIIFNNVIDDPFVGFVSRGELVLVENLMGEAIGGRRLRRMECEGGGRWDQARSRTQWYFVFATRNIPLAEASSFEN